MRLFPFEDESMILETSTELGMSDRSKLMMIIRDYNMDTDLIKNPKQKIAAEKKNNDILRQARNFDLIKLYVNGDIFDVSDLQSLEIKSKKNVEQEEVFNIKDFL